MACDTHAANLRLAGRYLNALEVTRGDMLVTRGRLSAAQSSSRFQKRGGCGTLWSSPFLFRPGAGSHEGQPNGYRTLTACSFWIVRAGRPFTRAAQRVVAR